MSLLKIIIKNRIHWSNTQKRDITHFVLQSKFLIRQSGFCVEAFDYHYNIVIPMKMPLQLLSNNKSNKKKTTIPSRNSFLCKYISIMQRLRISFIKRIQQNIFFSTKTENKIYKYNTTTIYNMLMQRHIFILTKWTTNFQASLNT